MSILPDLGWAPCYTWILVKCALEILELWNKISKKPSRKILCKCKECILKKRISKYKLKMQNLEHLLNSTIFYLYKVCAISGIKLICFLLLLYSQPGWIENMKPIFCWRFSRCFHYCWFVSIFENRNLYLLISVYSY